MIQKIINTEFTLAYGPEQVNDDDPLAQRAFWAWKLKVGDKQHGAWALKAATPEEIKAEFQAAADMLFEEFMKWKTENGG